MTATSDAREALAKLTPQARETHRVQLIIAELLIEQNEHLERLTAAVTRNTITNIRNAATDQGAGVSAVPGSADVPAPAGADEQEAGDVRLMEPDVPEVDGDQDDAGGRPAPAKKVAAKKATPAKKTAPRRPAAGRE